MKNFILFVFLLVLTVFTSCGDSSVEGYFVSVSSDGSTALIGIPGNDGGAGSAYIYKWNGSSWGEEKLIASDSTGGDKFGSSVSLSSDGSTALIGSPDDNNKTGAAYIYEWNGSSWDEEKLIASDSAGGNKFGSSVSLSSDGSTALIGSPDDNNKTGAAYIYEWSGSTWVEHKLTAADGTRSNNFGISVSISSDGETILLGASGDNNEAGSVYVYKWNGSSWDEEKLIASDSMSGDKFGSSVSLSSDGSTALIGSPDDNSKTGAAYIYEWSGSAWVEHKLTATDGTRSNNFGVSVSISSDGETILLGASGDNNEAGSVYVYKWNGSSWDEVKLIASDTTGGDKFGSSVSLSSDGNTSLIGITGNNGDADLAYVYEWNGSLWEKQKKFAGN